GDPFIKSLTDAATLTIVPTAERPAECAVAVLADCEVILPLEGLIDKAAEAARLRKALGDVEKQRASVAAKLSNPSFADRAPAEGVAKQRARLAELDGQSASLGALLAELSPPPGASRCPDAPAHL